MQLRVDTHNRRHEKREGFPLRQSSSQRPHDMRRFSGLNASSSGSLPFFYERKGSASLRSFPRSDGNHGARLPLSRFPPRKLAAAEVHGEAAGDAGGGQQRQAGQRDGERGRKAGELGFCDAPRLHSFHSDINTWLLMTSRRNHQSKRSVWSLPPTGQVKPLTPRVTS